MTVYNLYIFDRNCTCLYYKNWSKCKDPGISKDEELKLMYGMIFSVKSLIARLSHLTTKEGFVGYGTTKYKLHYFETATGLKFVLNTDVSVSSSTVLEHLRNIHATIFVEYVVRNPLYKSGEWIKSELFVNQLDSYIGQLPFYR